MRKLPSISCLLLLILLLPGCVHLGSGNPPNFVAWRPGLASSAQPNRGYLALAGERGYETIINLAPPDSMGSLADEAQVVTSQGLVYVNIPVDFDKPTLDDFQKFSDAMNLSAGKNVLVHCQVSFRASTFAFLYRVIRENVPSAEAAPLLTGVWVPNEVWMKFLDDTLAHYGKTAEIL